MNRRAFSLLEISLATAMLAVIVGTTTAGIAVDTRVEEVLTDGLGPRMAAQTALRQLCSELRMASISGEDLNGNGALDPAEDKNSDGLLDASWSLADESLAASSLTFDETVTLQETDLAASPETVTAPVTYRVVDSALLRSSGDGEIVVAQDVSAIRFSRSGKLVSVSLDVPGRTGTQTLTAQVWVRN